MCKVPTLEGWDQCIKQTIEWSSMDRNGKACDHKVIMKCLYIKKKVLAQTMITTNYTFYNIGMARLGPPRTHVPQHLRFNLEGELW